MEKHGKTWKNMEKHGKPWKNMEKHGKTWKNHGFHGISRVFIEICSRHSTISTSFNTPAGLFFFKIIIRHIGDVTMSWGYSSAPKLTDDTLW